ncbi:hypothetical protein GCM10023084_80420 [Streptomyces lacrimifluminis]|uniref:Uncharacterized protein n=1 Tax=Streptomyces lacrimifluminis TaxID=1500077 RepID=A0A917PCI8_9ACTN|nr:hypothetical protein [Streptomyces lacrimifluminis]GGJ70583.1 hypothetical protein GCM10012282_79300 [Streptomyces lacrimifluminis]
MRPELVADSKSAMAVNETDTAVIRPKLDLDLNLDLVAGEPAEVAARACVDASDGIGAVTSYATEVALPATGTWRNPGVGCGPTSSFPGAGLPLLFIEADNYTEEVPIIAAKFDTYMRHLHHKVRDNDGEGKSCRTRWSAPGFPGRSHGDAFPGPCGPELWTGRGWACVYAFTGARSA